MAQNEKNRDVYSHPNQSKSQNHYYVEQQVQQRSNPYVKQIAPTLFIVNFPENFTAIQLQELFAPYGKILSRQIIDKRNVGKKPYAFVQYEDVRDAVSAQEQLNNKSIEGRRITIQFKTGKKNTVISKPTNNPIDPRTNYYAKNANNQTNFHKNQRTFGQKNDSQPKETQQHVQNNIKYKTNPPIPTTKLVQNILASPTKKKVEDEEDGEILILDEIELDQSQLDKQNNESKQTNQNKNMSQKQKTEKKEDKNMPEIQFSRKQNPLDLRQVQDRLFKREYQRDYQNRNRKDYRYKQQSRRQNRDYHRKKKHRRRSQSFSESSVQNSSSISSQNKRKRSHDKKRQKKDNRKKKINKQEQSSQSENYNNKKNRINKQEMKQQSTNLNPGNQSKESERQQNEDKRSDYHQIPTRVPLVGNYPPNFGYESMFNPLMAYNPSDFVTKSQNNTLKIRIAELQKNNLELANKVQQLQYCFRYQGIDPSKYSSMYR